MTSSFDVILLMKGDMVTLNNDYSSFLVCVWGGELGGLDAFLNRAN